MRRALLLLLALAAAVAGCGTSDDRDQARAVVERFYDALRSDDAEAACAELSESLLEQVESQTQQSCEGVITRFEYDGGAIVGAEVYITNAKVNLRGGESAFLGREDGGWKLSAIACKAEKGKPADRPFDCEAEA
ncbi:MAG TPA: hypothetical protein VGW75_02885 [Solirubrobacteraceae bacterium]|jgi:hypothetical protein|nr:hypothetical protein [Solirubrobacteraceae bacterium]